MSERLEPSGGPEDVFRRVNAELEQTYRAIVKGLPSVGLMPFICECSDVRCTAVIRLELDEYVGIRAEPGHFAVVPGHIVRDFVHVAEENERYAVLVRDGDRALTNTY